ncbi:MAG TPA: thiamine-binding protein [Terracidiphilus sp.]
MRLELSVSPEGKSTRAGEAAVDAEAIAGASGVYCEKTSKGAVLEGDWEQLMTVAKKWHDEEFRKDESVTTVIRAVDSMEMAAHLRPSGTPGEQPEDDGEWLML